MRIINQTKKQIISENARLADTALSRVIGLLNRGSLSAGEGLVITQCRSIHMFFMKFSIDVIFVDRKNAVIGLVKRIQPFCMSPYFWRASCAIELPAGAIDATQTVIGDTVVWE